MAILFNEIVFRNYIYLKQQDDKHIPVYILSYGYFAFIAVNLPEKELCSKVENLDATEDREASEESHRASNKTQLGNQGHLSRKGQCKRLFENKFVTFTSLSTRSKVAVSK